MSEPRSVEQTLDDAGVQRAAQVMADHPVLVALATSTDSTYAGAGQAAIDELVRLRGENEALNAHPDRRSYTDPDLLAAARRVSRLLRGGMRDMPLTDLRADALEACAELEQLCDREDPNAG